MDCSNCCFKAQQAQLDGVAIQTVIAEPNASEYVIPAHGEESFVAKEYDSRDNSRVTEDTRVVSDAFAKPTTPPPELQEAVVDNVRIQKKPQEKKPLAIVPTTPTLIDPRDFPPINNEIKVTKIAEDNFKPPTSAFGKFRFRLEQQEKSTCALPMYCFSPLFSACCAGSCCVVLLLIGLLALMTAGSIKEVVVSYKYPDTFKEFVVEEDMDGDVNMWYDMKGVILNQKRYIENTDSDVIKLMPMGGKKKCKDSGTKSDAQWRRIDREASIRAAAGDTKTDTWSTLVQSQASFKPCGLQSIAMFTDNYSLEKKDATVASGWVSQALDESDISLKEDDDFFNKRIKQENGVLMIEGEQSWIQAGNFYNHFKVWMRSPASTHVRHLWAVKKDGLKKGTYKLNFLENSAIWTAPKDKKGWGVDEKRVIFSTQKSLGSKGACVVLSIICFVVAFIEAVVMVFFLVLRMKQ